MNLNTSVAHIPGSTDILVLTAILMNPNHFGGGGSSALILLQKLLNF
jgi:hypothetical protein